MSFIEIVQENYIILALVLTPLFYFVFRDIVSVYRNKKNIENHKQRIIESERRIFQLLQESDTNKAELIAQISSIRQKMSADIDRVNQSLDDKNHIEDEPKKQ